MVRPRSARALRLLNRVVCINLSGLFVEPFAPGHDGIRTSPSQLSIPACKAAASSIGFSGDAG